MNDDWTLVEIQLDKEFRGVPEKISPYFDKIEEHVFKHGLSETLRIDYLRGFVDEDDLEWLIIWIDRQIRHYELFMTGLKDEAKLALKEKKESAINGT